MISNKQLQASKRHPPRVCCTLMLPNDTFRRRWAFQAFLNDTFRRVWALPKGGPCQASFNDILWGIWIWAGKIATLARKSSYTGRRSHFFPKPPGEGSRLVYPPGGVWGGRVQPQTSQRGGSADKSGKVEFSDVFTGGVKGCIWDGF